MSRWTKGVSSAQSLDEAGAGAGAAFAEADVFHGGDFGDDVFLVFLVDRHGPDEFAGRFSGGDECIADFFLGREHAGAAMTERHDDRAGERGIFEDRGGLVGEARVGDGVGEDDAALGVGVEHLDRLAVAGRDDVAGAVGVGPGHVFRRGNEADDVERQLEVGRGEHHADHGDAAHLVLFHFVHLRAGLDRDAAGVERDRLADERDGRFAFSAAAIFDDDEPRRVRREPWPTPRMPPKPSRLRWRSFQIFTVSARPCASSCAFSARIAGVSMLAGRLPMSRMVLLMVRRSRLRAHECGRWPLRVP